MYIAKSSLNKGFTVNSISANNQNYTLEMNDTQDGPMDLFTVAFSGCILMCVKGYFFRKYDMKDLKIEIDLSVDYENKKCLSYIKVDYEISEEDIEGILNNIKLRCKISHLLSDEVELKYEIKGK
ncbi:OsmC family protein [Gemelliphila palaticanis]|uniref:OsmC family protein n=1 Tax=Gemelliphila palaticanis TaxID=81950 RepID=A0ABX2T1K6_9BACL|nr:OsmC family protein [Gemella palaticanis]MBF0715404.1 OsmC family protein [Gemella palaticanis]NYS47334.1 OsmC family protein [Gemella palaticanis]